MSVEEWYSGSKCHQLVEGKDGFKVTACEKKPSSLWQGFAQVFLPAGFPASVSPDYVEYQFWDTAQALCSYITGSLATQAIMKGVGVGDDTATAAGAAITWMLRDGTGMLGRILFTWSQGTDLDCNSKQWRLCADVLNDIAIFVELLAPGYPDYFVALVCFASVAKSIVGVAGGATRAALTQHQARANNTGDVSAKDGSQETIINLLGLLLSIFIAPLVADNTVLLWTLFVTFTLTHIFCNYRAVSSLLFDQFNARRAELVFTDFLKTGEVQTPRWAAARESVFPALFTQCPIRLGASISKCIRSPDELSKCLGHGTEGYLMQDLEDSISVVLSHTSEGLHAFKALYHAHSLKMLRREKDGIADCAAATAITEAKGDLNPGSIKNFVDTSFEDFLVKAVEAGWDTNRFLLNIGDWRADWTNKKRQ